MGHPPHRTSDDDTWVADWLSRLSIDGCPPATKDTLNRITAAHLAAIPFENLTVLAGDVPAIDHAALVRKLTRGRRGGYCFELNTLLCSGLVALGFEARLCMARVLWNRDRPGPRTHCVVLVALGAETFLVDVGFGGPGPSAPVRLDLAGPVTAGDGTFRFEDRPGLGLLLNRKRDSGEEVALYAVTDEVTALSDLESGNWLAATLPTSIFRRTLVVARQVDGARRTIEGTQFKEVVDGALTRSETLGNVTDVVTCLAESFGIEADDRSADALAVKLAFV